jgi:hypothetical protein
MNMGNFTVVVARRAAEDMAARPDNVRGNKNFILSEKLA